MPANTAGSSTRASTSKSAAGEDAAGVDQPPPASNSKNKGKGKAKSKKSSAPKVATPAKVEAERTSLLSEKQTELAAVLDRHDDLIREKFHMETFVMMVDYDPEVAKQDESKVFQDFKSRHDLLDTVAPPTSSPRKTRSSHAGLLSLGGVGPSSSAGPSNSTPKPKPKSTSNSNSTSYPVAGPSNSRPSPKKSPTKDISITRPKIIVRYPARRKGKEKAAAVDVDMGEAAPKPELEPEREPEPESISVGVARTRGRTPATANGSGGGSARQLRKRAGVSSPGPGEGPRAAPEQEPEPESISVALARGRTASAATASSQRQLRKRAGASPEPGAAPTASAPAPAPANGSEREREAPPPRKRRKIDDAIAKAAATPSISAPVNGRVLRGKGRPPDPEPEPEPDPAPAPAPAPEPPRDPTVGGKSITAPVGGRVMPHRSAAHRPQVPAPPLPHRRAVPVPSTSTDPPAASHRKTAAVSAPSPPSPPIKRIKLLVRRPPPKHLSHPRQRPPPPLFNSSLGAFLGSWSAVEVPIGQSLERFPVQDAGMGNSNLNGNGLGGANGIASTSTSKGENANTNANLNADLLRLAEREAALWERVEGMKRAGLWFGSGVFDAFRMGGDGGGGSNGVSGVGTPLLESTRAEGSLNSGPDDAWAAVVRAVVAYGRRTRSSTVNNNNATGNPKSLMKKKTRGAVVAGQVAAKVQAYWDGEAAKRERGRVVEERRLRGLAKSVGRLVAGEWKKAVFHIREQERLKLEAEELKRGQTHLDAILDQSGIILETQQGDLSRGVGDAFRSRSRSSSVGATMMGWGEEDEEEEEEERSESEAEGDEDGEGGGDEDEAEGDDIMRQEEGEGDVTDTGQIDHDTTKDGDDGEDEGEPSEPGDYLQTPGSTTSALPDAYPSTPASEFRSLAGDDEERDVDDEDDSMSAVAVEDMMNEEVFSSPVKPPLPALSSGADSEPEDSADLDHEPHNSADLDEETNPTPDQPPPPDSLDEAPVNPSTAVLTEDVEMAPTSPVVQDDPITEDASAGPNSAFDADAGAQDARKEEEFTEDAPVGPNSPVDADAGTQDPQEEEEASTEPDEEEERPSEPEIPAYLRPYAVAPVEWDATKRVTPPLLLRGFLRPYQQSGLEWLASLHVNNLNGILADEMGLGKTIQTIALLAHLACDRGIWGPHLIIVPTSVLLNWEMEFKKFLPGFRTLSYHGSTKRRRELRQGWNEKHHLNVCITSYTLASRDAVVLKRKPWYYMILDEAHMIKNFKSQRWNTLLMFRSFRRLLLTGTPLQNNLTELWALLQFLMSGSDFVNLKEFGDWFSNPLEKAIEAGNAMDEDTMQRVTKLHTVLRPYLLRRLKRDVEKELPSKYEHLVLCPLSKRQRFLYDEFMSRAHTRDALQSGVYQKIANILMQLRKVCNHPDLFEVRPIVTSFAMERSAIADFEIKELLVRRRLLNDEEETLDLDLLGLRFIDRQNTSLIAAQETRRLDGTTRLPFISEIPEAPPPKDTRTIAGWRAYSAYQHRAATISRWAHIGYVNRLRCKSFPIYSSETLNVVRRFHHQLLPLSAVDTRSEYLDTVYLVNAAVKSYATRAEEMVGIVDRFAFVTPPVVALDLPRIALIGHEERLAASPPDFDAVLHRASVKLQIAFPDPSLLQYDCGKLQQLARLLREKKAGGHRVLIFTQMTKILDILEIYLNFHGYLYLRLDGATKIEDRQYITERFNADPRVFCFIASSRSGGVGINLTGADTVVFYDSDFNPQMDRQCEDRAHRIGQIRDVHIYRFVSSHTVEEAMLRKANQKRSLDDLVIQKGEFDWRSLFADDGSGVLALEKALGEFDDTEDAHAAAVAAREEIVLQGQDQADFLDVEAEGTVNANVPAVNGATIAAEEQEPDLEEPEEEGGSIADYMIAFVQRDAEFFRDWKL